MGAVNQNQQTQINQQIIKSEAAVVFMDTEIRFSRKEFAEAFKKKISEEAKKRLWAYYKTGSAIDAIRLLGMSSGIPSWTRRLREIAKQLGANSLGELFGLKKEKKKVVLLEDQTGTHEVTGKYLLGLIEKQNFKCALSGHCLLPNEAALDHVLPYEAGGRHEPGNVQWVHCDVNKMKSQMRQEVFIDWCMKITRHVEAGAGDTSRKKQIT
jgi:hypothetical protein